jgi:hypothetical protein
MKDKKLWIKLVAFVLAALMLVGTAYSVIAMILSI